MNAEAMKVGGIDYSALKSNHDLSLPDWGPYSKRLFGLSHLADKARGGRMDFVVIPGISRRPLAIPDAGVDSGYLPWESTPYLTYYSYRQQVEWKDRVYCDISFSQLDQSSRLIRCECVNNSELAVPFSLHLLAMPAYPEKSAVTMIADDPASVWLDACEAERITYAVPGIRDNLSWDGRRRGEEPNRDCVNGNCIGRNFGKNSGDVMTFIVPTALRGHEIVVRLRYHLESGEIQKFELNGVKSTLCGGGEWRDDELFRGEVGERLELVGMGGGGVKIDGLALLPAVTGGGVSFARRKPDTRTVSCPGSMADSRIVSCASFPQRYGLWWSRPAAFVRHYAMPDMLHTLRYTPRVSHPFHSDKGFQEGDEYAVDAVIQPVTVKPGESEVVHYVVCTLPLDGGESGFGELVKTSSGFETAWKKARAARIRCSSAIPAGKDYEFSQERMTAVTMTNIVYPIRVMGQNIKHHTPGRLWNSLYTWDSGFIGLGLLEMDIRRAVESLNTYLTEPGDEENAFIDHGSWVPTQIYLFNEILNRIEMPGFIEFFYPRLRQYYLFFAGRAKGSITAKAASGLLRTWDYNYNSGGWDDYPPQWDIHQSGDHHIAPAVSSAHAIRCAKILARAAECLNLSSDAEAYRKDMEVFSSALQKYSWDAECGYFSYVTHDDQGNATGFFHHSSGANYNMGLDGASPLIAGICTEEQKNILWGKLSSEEHCWTRCGLSTVDRGAPYFRHDGYWNGSVWMPHQWFFWKAALDCAQMDFAWQIAFTALELWKRETGASYCCYEHFDISSCRGAGWHHFSGLSTPVLMWFGAYFSHGRLTGGFNTHFSGQRSSGSIIEADVTIEEGGSTTAGIIAVTGEGEWLAEINHQELPTNQRLPGILEIILPCPVSGRLTIRKK